MAFLSVNMYTTFGIFLVAATPALEVRSNALFVQTVAVCTWHYRALCSRPHCSHK